MKYSHKNLTQHRVVLSTLDFIDVLNGEAKTIGVKIPRSATVDFSQPTKITITWMEGDR